MAIPNSQLNQSETHPTSNPIPIPENSTPHSTPKPKKTSTPLIIGLTVGGVALIGIIVTLVVAFLGNKIDYAATYEAFKPLESSMDDLDYGSCYDVNHDFDDSDITTSEYSESISSCVKEFSAIASATDDFAKSSGAKKDETIKSAFDSFKSALDSVYSAKDFASQLALYNTYHEFFLTITNSESNADSLESAIIASAKLFQDTNNSALTEFANGFRERGLAYVNIIKSYQNGSASYSDVYDKMEEFTDYIEDSAPEVSDVSGLDFEKVNDLEDAYSKLSEAVHDAYYDHI